MAASLRWHYPGQVVSGRQRRRCPLSPFDELPRFGGRMVRPRGRVVKARPTAAAVGRHGAWPAPCDIVARSAQSRMNVERRGDEPSGDRRTRELELLAESSRLLTATLGLAEVLDRLAAIAQARIGVDAVRIWVLEEGTRLRLGAQKGWLQQPTTGVPNQLSLTSSIAGWVISEKK